MPLFTRIMSKEQYGIITDYNSWHYIIEVFAVLGLASVGSFNVGLNEYRDRRDRFVSSMLVLGNVSTILVFGLVFIIKGFIFKDFILSWSLLILMMAGFVFSPATTFFLARKRYEYKYKIGAVVTLASIAATQGLAILLVILGSGNEGVGTGISGLQLFGTEIESSELKVIGTVAGILLFGIPLYIHSMAKGGVKPDRKICREMFIFTVPLLPHYLALHVMNGADRIMVGKLDSVSSEAVYGVASSVGVAAATVWTAINGSLQPYLFGKLNEKDYVSARRAVNRILAVYAGLCVAIAMAGPEILMILAPSQYSDGLAAIPPIVGMAFLNALYNVYASVEFYHKKSVGIAIATIIAAALNIVLNAWLVPIYGLSAAAYTTLIANAVLTFCHYIGYRRAEEQKIFSDLFLFIISVSCIIACLLAGLLYELVIVRYAIILVVVVIMLVKHREIIKIL